MLTVSSVRQENVLLRLGSLSKSQVQSQALSSRREDGDDRHGEGGGDTGRDHVEVIGLKTAEKMTKVGVGVGKGSPW